MSEETPGQGALTRAQEFGVESYPAPLRQMLIAMGLVRKVGLGATVKHAISVIERRLHHRFVDRHLHAHLPYTDAREITLQGLSLRTVEAYEAAASYNSGITPARTFAWAIAAAGIDPREFHFIDIGSGWGSLLLPVAAHPFLGYTGIEFAKELHEKATANLAAARAKGLIARDDMELRNESALETQLPDAPLLIFMFCPFREAVMRPFVDRIDEAVRLKPRPVVVIYVNPLEGQVFERPHIREIPLRGRQALYLKLFSPYLVRAYSWDVTRAPASKGAS